jgi:hypothetical protein
VASLSKTVKVSLKNIVEEARNKYRPRNIKYLLIAEAPPREYQRFFYFENVRDHDSLFLETMKVLYPAQYKDTKTVRANKASFLKQFMEDGFYLLDAASSSIMDLRQRRHQIRQDFSHLLIKVDEVISDNTKIILISRPVYDVCFEALKNKGYRIINTEMIDFPGSGGQVSYRNKMQKILA